METIVLDSFYKALSAKLDGAPSLDPTEYTAHYAKVSANSFEELTNSGTISDTSYTTLVPAPAVGYKHIVKEVTIYNADALSIGLNVLLYDTGNYRKIWVGTVGSHVTWSLSDGLSVPDVTLYPSKMTELIPYTAPTVDDLLWMVDDPSGTPISRKITWLNFAKSISGTGWIDPGETWTYASATTFTIANVDRTSIYIPGRKLTATNSGTKYWVVVSSSFSTNTTVTVAGNAVANAAISANFIATMDVPQGFPATFTDTPTMDGSAGTAGAYAEDQNFAAWSVRGRRVLYGARKRITNVGSWSGNVQFNFGANAITPSVGGTAPRFGTGWLYATGANVSSPKGIISISAATTLTFYKTLLANLQWSDMAANDYLEINMTYDF